VRKLKLFLMGGATVLIVVGSVFSVMTVQAYGHHDPVLINSIAPSSSSLSSNRYTQPETAAAPVVDNPFVTLDGYTSLGTQPGSNLEFYVKASDLSFRVKDLATGYVWGSSVRTDYFNPASPLYDAGDMGINAFWRNKLNSPLLINYFQGTLIKEENLFESIFSHFTYRELAEAGRTGFEADLAFFLSKINLTIKVYIDATGLHIEIPFDSISETAEMPLASISVYPLLGATKRLRTTGYAFFPDGIGALMRFDDDATKGIYSKRYFGPDTAIGLKQTEESLFANVYGMVHGVNDNAFLGIIKDGAGNALLTSIPSGNTTDFNWTYTSYEYRVAYTQYLNQSQTSSITLVQTDMNPIDIGLEYRFLHGADANYVGMANAYHGYLAETDGLAQNSATGDVPLHLDVLASENKKSILGRSVFSMTTISELESIIADLGVNDITKLNINYYGWAKGGYSYRQPNQSKIERKVGSKSAFITLNNDYQTDDISIYYGADYTYAYATGRGYNNSDVTQTIGQQLLSSGSQYYLLNPVYGLARYQSEYASMNEYGIQTVALETIGDKLYSQYGGGVTSRSATIPTVKSYLDVASKTSVNRPYSYLWSADAINDIPLYSSQEARFSDTVPFIPLVLSGCAERFGRPSNFFSNTSNELLRMIDYNLYPSFYITNESSYLLLDTGSQDIYTSKYSDWKAEILRQYAFVNDALKPVLNQTVAARTVLHEGVVKVTYGNGVIIYINYTGSNVVADGVTIPAIDYEVVNP